MALSARNAFVVPIACLVSAVACSAFVACSSDPTPSQMQATESTAAISSAVREAPYLWWRAERDRRQREIDTYLASSDDFPYFKDNAVGQSGLPVEIHRLLPEMMPEFWGSGNPDDPTDLIYPFRKFGMQQDPWSPTSLLPFGMGQTKGTDVLIPIPGLDKLRMNLVTLTCAACHVGQVIGPDNLVHFLVGAPNTTFDSDAYRVAVTNSLNDSRFTGPNIKRAMHAHPVGYFYNPHDDAQEILERSAFDLKAAEVVDIVKERAVHGNWDLVEKYWINTAYSGQTSENARGHTPGRLDPFGVINALVLDEAHAKFAPTHGAMVDPMAVWRQNDRLLGNWDGNQSNKIYRNLAVAFGIIGDAHKITLNMSQHTTAFTNDLPPPPYLWDIDNTRVRRGQLLFQQTCSGCHQGSNKYVYPLERIGTDPNRALYSYTDYTRKLLIAQLRIACTDPVLCDVPDSEILREAGKDVGYMAEPLDGIWARAPYFHNGSVPTLEQVLVPGDRPAIFVRGNIEYDTQNVGFVWNRPAQGSSIYNTALEGNSNRGHDTPEFLGTIDWANDPEKRADLLEYLKTL